MKRFFKTAVNFIAVAIITLSVFGFSACEDIRKLELDLKIYNFTDSKFYDAEDVKFTVELYRHLADETVDAVLDYLNTTTDSNRRVKLFLSCLRQLKAFESDYGQICVVHYGY